MKLEYGAFTLGDEEDDSVIEDNGGDNTRVNQKEPRADGGEIFLAARGNNANQRSFTVTVEHATAADSIAWFDSHPDTLPGSGTLKVTEGEYESESDAVLDSVNRVARSGLTTILRYNFTTGKIIAAEPEEP